MIGVPSSPMNMVSVANFDTPARTRLMVWALFNPCTYAISAPVSKWCMRRLALFHFSFTPQHGCVSRSCGLHFNSIGSALLNSTSFRLQLCHRVGSQPIHSTSTFKLNAVASELVECRSTCAAERDDVAVVAHLSNEHD